MNDNQITEILDILTDVDRMLRERLAEAGFEIPHVIVAIAADGAGIVRSNVGPDGLRDMGDLLTDMAKSAAMRRPDNEPLN